MAVNQPFSLRGVTLGAALRPSRWSRSRATALVSTHRWPPCAERDGGLPGVRQGAFRL